MNWTEQEDAILKANEDGEIKELRKMLPGRTGNAIRTRMQRLGLRQKKAKAASSSIGPNPPERLKPLKIGGRYKVKPREVRQDGRLTKGRREQASDSTSKYFLADSYEYKGEVGDLYMFESSNCGFLETFQKSRRGITYEVREA